MYEETGRQSRRIAQRKNGGRRPPGAAAVKYTDENISAQERRHALLALVLVGLVIVAVSAAYVFLAAGDILQ